MSATHWLTLGIVSGLGALGGATSLKPTPVESGSAVMIDSLASRSYATTLEGVQAAHRTVLQNLANAQTPGYRAVRPMFEAWLDETARTSGAMLPTMEPAPSRAGPSTPAARWTCKSKAAATFRCSPPTPRAAGPTPAWAT